MRFVSNVYPQCCFISYNISNIAERKGRRELETILLVLDLKVSCKTIRYFLYKELKSLASLIEAADWLIGIILLRCYGKSSMIFSLEPIYTSTKMFVHVLLIILKMEKNQDAELANG